MNKVKRIDRSQSGFTLLEALVALVLFSSTGMALYSWINTSVISLTRVEEANNRQIANQMALDYLVHVNPMSQNFGEAQLSNYQIVWESVPIEQPRRAKVPYAGLGNFHVGLYEVRVRVLADEKELSSFKVRQVGYEQIQKGIPEFL